jgi:hypothetical protein
MLRGNPRSQRVQPSHAPFVIETLERRSLLSGTLIPQTITVRVFFDRNSDQHRNRWSGGACFQER